MNRCRICETQALETSLRLGPQPVSSHFAAAADAPAVMHELSLGVCTSCGVVQLFKPFPYPDLVPPFDWINYREPEDHLDDVVDKVILLPGINKSARVLGLTFKDRTTLDRLSRHGFSETDIIDAGADLGAKDPNANIESAQALLTPETAEKIVAHSGPADLLVVRHILEHAEDTRRFMAALDILLAKGGHAIIEVPDCTANLERMDYTMIWEEHVSYFTLETLPQVLSPVGLECLGVDIHPYPFEDVLVLYARKPATGAQGLSMVPRQAVAQNISLARRYGAEFAGWTQRYHGLFEKLTCDGRRLAAYGAGHLTSAFIQFHDLHEYLAFVVDDTAHKQGLYLPGSGLPIVPRDRLNADEIALCLFGLAPEIEDKIIAKNRAFVDASGRFASMFADSRRSIRALLPE